MIRMTEERRRHYLQQLAQEQREETAFRRERKSNPFKRGSIMRSVFELCRKGTTRKALFAYIDEIGGDFSYYLRLLRQEFAHGVEWKLEEEKDGSLRVKLK